MIDKKHKWLKIAFSVAIIGLALTIMSTTRDLRFIRTYAVSTAWIGCAWVWLWIIWSKDEETV